MATGLYIKTFYHTYLLLLALIIIIQHLMHSLSICKTSGLSKKISNPRTYAQYSKIKKPWQNLKKYQVLPRYLVTSNYY
jgi:hypothetical protein